MGEKAANEAGHVANMVNQLRVALYDIRTECLKYHYDQNASELRKCPYCGHVWAKVEGCEGETSCGNRPETVNDMRGSEYAVLSTYTFIWSGGSLRIEKSEKRRCPTCGSQIAMERRILARDVGSRSRGVKWLKLMFLQNSVQLRRSAQMISKFCHPRHQISSMNLSGMIKLVKYSMKLSEPR